MRNQKKASDFGKDLITDINCFAGWEADFVIYLGLRDVDEFAFMSRCRGQFHTVAFWTFTFHKE